MDDTCAQIVTVVLSLQPYRETKRNCKLKPKFGHSDGSRYCTRHHNELVARAEREAELARFMADLPRLEAERLAFEETHAPDPCRACGHAYKLHSQHDCQHVMNYDCGRDGHWWCRSPGCGCGLPPKESFFT
jgi:hypothetical protein